MDPSKFTKNRTGEVVQITTPIRDYAFIPFRLPPSWEPPQETIDLLIEAVGRLGTLNGIGRTLSDPELLLQPLQHREALQSSALEGTYATPEEMLLFAKNPREAKSERDPVNSWREVFNYQNCLTAGIERMATLPLSLRVIRDMHEILMRGVRGRDKTPGSFRVGQNAIGSTHRFIPPPAAHLGDLLSNLEHYINAPSDELNALIRAFLVHYQFEAIHPFNDGNGRIGRALLALMIYRDFGHAHPWLYLSAYFERHRDEYIDHLFRVSSNGEWNQWCDFCLRATISQADDSIQRCDLLGELRSRYHQRIEGAATPRTGHLIERLFSETSLSVTEHASRCGVAYKTARSDIRALVKVGILKKIPDHYPAVYYAWEIFRIAYNEVPEFASPDEIDQMISLEVE